MQFSKTNLSETNYEKDLDEYRCNRKEELMGWVGDKIAFQIVFSRFLPVH